MDSNLTSCNRCGHTSSQDAEVCAYCGADLPGADKTGSGESGDAGFNKPGEAGTNHMDIAATELKTAATVVEMPGTGTTENAGSKEAAKPIAAVAAPTEDIKMDEIQAGIEIPERPEITAAEPSAAAVGEVMLGDDAEGDVSVGESAKDEVAYGEGTSGEDTPEDSIVDTLQHLSASAAEPVEIPADVPTDSVQDRGKLVFDLPAETSVADIIPKDNSETEAADNEPKSDSSTLKTADPETVEPEKTNTATEAPADVISLVRELAVNSQPEASADASADEVEISIEPIEEDPAPEAQTDSTKSEKLEETIVLTPEAEVAPVEIDLKDTLQDSKAEAADQKEPESLITGDTAAAKPEPVLPPEQGQDNGVMPERSGKVTAGLDSEPESPSDDKKEVSKAQIIALKKRKLAKIAALKKKKMALAKAKALEKKKAALVKAQAMKKKKEAQAALEAAGQKVQLPEETAEMYAVPQQDADSGISALLEKYKGQPIGINYDNLAEIGEADLVEVNEAYFSVLVKDKKVRYSFPVKTILSIQESEDGVEVVESGKKTNYEAVVKVFPVVLF